MFEMALGSPGGALVFFVLFTTIGVLLGGVFYACCAYPGARREQFRVFGAMPRTGAILGVAVATAIVGYAWQHVYRDFYRIQIEDEAVRLYYHMPPRTVALSRNDIVGMRKHIVLGKGGTRSIVLQTARGNFQSGNLGRSGLDAAWEALSPYFTPLP